MVEQRWQALRRLRGRIDEAAERALQTRHRISVSEYHALVALARSPDEGRLRQLALADAIPLNHSSVTRLVGRLERVGLAVRHDSAADRRGVYTQITAKGRQLVALARMTYLRSLNATLDRAQRDPDLAPHVHYLRGQAQPPRQSARRDGRP